MMPYTMQTLPEFIKKKPKAVQEQWLKVFNASYSKGEGYAFKAANAAIKEATGSDLFSKTLLTALLADIEAIIAKAGDGLKGREGSPAVRAFLKEVKAKVKNMIVKIEDKETRVLAESAMLKIEEALKDGSFGDIEDKVRAAIKASGIFPDKVGEKYMDGPYVRDMYPDRCVVSYEGRLWELSYALMNGAVVLGLPPKEVIEQYVYVKEGAKKEEKVESASVREAAIEIREAAVDRDLDISTFISLKEAKFNDDFSQVEVVLIEAGTNEHKKRHYPDKTIREAAGIFKGWKNYINHPTPTEERERPERDLKDWASTIVESHYDTGKAIGVLAIHDVWLRERLADPVAREHIGLSILAGGKISVGKVGGKDGYQIVEAIIPARKNGPPSVDWVTEAGARGRVSRLLESKRTGGSHMELEQATAKDLKESRPDLVESIIKDSESGKAQEKKDAELKEANAKIAEFQKKEKISEQAATVDTQLKEAKLPEAAKDRIREHFKATLVEGDLKEAVAGMIKQELAYINKLSENGKIKLGGDGHTDGSTLKESLQENLDARAGVQEKKEDKK